MTRPDTKTYTSPFGDIRLTVYRPHTRWVGFGPTHGSVVVEHMQTGIKAQITFDGCST